MKNKIVYSCIGKVLIGLAISFTFPLICALIYGESFVPFIIPQIISLIIGVFLNLIPYSKTESIFAKDGLKIVALSWIVVSIVGALPMYINKDASFIDSLFESTSGFTTTGATIFRDIEHLNKSILFWRSFTHFIGGMGVIAFVTAIIPLSSKSKFIQVLKVEKPGTTVGKLVLNIKKTLGVLYGIYIGLTFTEFIILVFGRMPVFDSLLLSFGTAGTGGFAVLNSSVASYSTFCKYVIAIFMLLFGVNFNVYFLILMKDAKNALKSEELRVYIFIFITSLIIVFSQTLSVLKDAGLTFTEAFFHISSIISSTGYSIGDINIYPTSSRILILIVMIVSACAGSTCGGMKIQRVIISLKSIKRDLTKMIHPNSVQTVKFEGKKVSEETIKNTNTFIFLYLISIIVICFIVSFDGYSIETTINAVFTTIANVGLCFNISNFADFSVLSKLALAFVMLCGRLEIFPLIALGVNSNKE